MTSRAGTRSYSVATNDRAGTIVETSVTYRPGRWGRGRGRPRARPPAQRSRSSPRCDAARWRASTAGPTPGTRTREHAEWVFRCKSMNKSWRIEDVGDFQVALWDAKQSSSRGPLACAAMLKRSTNQAKLWKALRLLALWSHGFCDVVVNERQWIKQVFAEEGMLVREGGWGGEVVCLLRSIVRRVQRSLCFYRFGNLAQSHRVYDIDNA